MNGASRSLSDIGLSTAANDAPASALFSAQKQSRPPHISAARTNMVRLIRRTVRPQRIPPGRSASRRTWGWAGEIVTPPAFLRLRPRIGRRLLRLVTNGNVRQAPRRWQWWLILATVTGILWGCDGESPTPANNATNEVHGVQSLPDADSTGSSDPAPPQKDTVPRIVAFGDSLTAGLGVAPQDAYPAQLQRRLDALGYRYHIVNAGVSGDTTAGGVRRVSWILSGNPSMVILELGGNDGLRGLGIEQTRSNLEAIIVRLKEAGVLTILAGMKLPPNYGVDYTTRFESMYRDLAIRYSLPLIPFLLEGVGGDRRLNQPDGIHPTGKGYRIVADNVLRTLEPLLDRPVMERKGTGHTKTDQRPSGRRLGQTSADGGEPVGD